jgi:hypothetical protein
MMIKGLSFSLELLRKLVAASFGLLYFTILVVDTDLLHDCSNNSGEISKQKIPDKANKACCEDDSNHLKLNSYIKVSEAAIHSLRVLPEAIVPISDRVVKYVTSTSINSLLRHSSLRSKNASLLILYSIFRI